MNPSIADTIFNSPKNGAIATASTLVASHLVPFINNGHINPLYMDIMQLGGYTTTVIVGIYTIIGYIKKNNYEKNK
jgi:hypothetical protein